MSERLALTISPEVTLQSIELTGYRSFAVPATLEFSPRITCLVGPDGCGKSSVLSSIIWALGGGSEDVVFRGTASRPASAGASVSLSFVDGIHEYRVTRTSENAGKALVEEGGSRYVASPQDFLSRLESLVTVIDSIDGLSNMTSAEHGKILLLDEIDAGIDAGEGLGFASLLSEKCRGHQIIVASHFKSTMAIADTIVGVMMEEYGVSKLLGLKEAD